MVLGAVDGLGLVALFLEGLRFREDDQVVQLQFIEITLDKFRLILLHEIGIHQNFLHLLLMQILGNTGAIIHALLLGHKIKLHLIDIFQFLYNPLLGALLLEHLDKV